MAKAIVRIGLLKEMIKQCERVVQDPKHDQFGMTGLGQWKESLERKEQEGLTEIDLTMTTFNLEPIVKIVEE